MSVIRGGNNNKNRWHVDEVFGLIDVVKNNGCIYNSHDKNYYSRTYIENLWHDIDIQFGKRPGSSLSKWTNLRISFRREYMMLIRDNMKPSWIFFEKMLFLQQFLRRKRPRSEKLETHIQDALEQISSITRGNFKNYIENIERCEPEPSESEEATITEVCYQTYLVKDEETSTGQDNETDDDPVEEILEIQDTDSVLSDNGGEEVEKSATEEEIRREKFNEDRSEFQSESRTEHTENRCDEACSNSMSLSRTLCECKSNPDAMFLMSLMPDIQLLSRKDRGKFKIEVQKIIQDLLYPDE